MECSDGSVEYPTYIKNSPLLSPCGASFLSREAYVSVHWILLTHCKSLFKRYTCEHINVTLSNEHLKFVNIFLPV